MAQQAKIVLVEDIYKLGSVGDVVTVKPGYARNYLLPKGYAMRATKANLEFFEARKADLLEKARKNKENAVALSKKIDGKVFNYVAAASERDMLYGAVTPTTIADLLAEKSIIIHKNTVQIAKPIKVLGLHDIRIILHNDVISVMTLNIARSEEEAKDNLNKSKEDQSQQKDDLDALNISGEQPVEDSEQE